MKIRNIIAFLSYTAVALILISGCKKDPYKDVMSNERSLEAFTISSGQIGPAVIDRATGVVKINVVVQDGTDLSKITPVVQASYKASVSPASGEQVNFDTNHEVSYTVTAESGETRLWKVQLVPFTETLLGTYDITGLVLFGGTGVEYGGGALINLPGKSVWPALDGAVAEMDNSLTFTYTGSTDDGKTTGTVINNAGSDGAYANFIYTPTPQTDVNKFYRKIPKGEAKWIRDYAAKTVTFTFADGTTTVANFSGAGKEDLGNGFNKTITDNSFVFVLNGNDDWSSIYSDYDRIVKKPRKYWIDVKKRN